MSVSVLSLQFQREAESVLVYTDLGQREMLKYYLNKWKLCVNSNYGWLIARQILKVLILTKISYKIMTIFLI